jgi:two-component system, NarL family, response regulator LiaR
MQFRISEAKRQIIIYGLSLAVLLFLLKWLEIKYVLIDHAMDFYIGSIALLFTILGIWLALKIYKPKPQTIVIEKEVYIHTQPDGTAAIDFVQNEKAIEKLNLSSRELEVLQHMAKGLSNQEIAESLYVSQNTVKTHAANLFMKLDVKRRTQAVDQARKLGIIG